MSVFYLVSLDDHGLNFWDGQIMRIEITIWTGFSCLIPLVLKRVYIVYVLSKWPRAIDVLFNILGDCLVMYAFLFWNSSPQTCPRSGRGTEALPKGRPRLQPKDKNRSVGLSQNLAWIQEKNFEERFEVVKVIGWAEMSELIYWGKNISSCM